MALGRSRRGNSFPRGVAVPSVFGVLADTAEYNEKSGPCRAAANITRMQLPGSGATFSILLHFSVFPNCRICRWCGCEQKLSGGEPLGENADDDVGAGTQPGYHTTGRPPGLPTAASSPRQGRPYLDSPHRSLGHRSEITSGRHSKAAGRLPSSSSRSSPADGVTGSCRTSGGCCWPRSCAPAPTSSSAPSLTGSRHGDRTDSQVAIWCGRWPGRSGHR